MFRPLSRLAGSTWDRTASEFSLPTKKTERIQTLKEAFGAEASKTDQPRLLLTAALSPNPWQVRISYDPTELASNLDFMNILTYDLHGAWDKPLLTRHDASLYATNGDPKRNVDFLLKLWADFGVPNSKILVGIPLYAKTYTLADSDVKGALAPAVSPGRQGMYTGEPGFLSYFEVCALLGRGDETHVIPNTRGSLCCRQEKMECVRKRRFTCRKVKSV